MKFCGRCGTEKPLDEFNRDRHSKDGRHHMCRACEARRRKENPGPRQQRDRQTRRDYENRSEEQVLADRARLRPTGLKRCHTCRVYKEFSAFYRDALRVDGLANKCRECASAKRLPHDLLDRWEDQDTWTCVYCGKPFEEVEHVLPRALGGTNDPRNLVPSCADCNRGPGGKHDMDPVTWMETRFPELLKMPVVFEITLTPSELSG